MGVAPQIQLYPQHKAFFKQINAGMSTGQATSLARLRAVSAPPSLHHVREYLGNRHHGDRL
jgi:hypothetical protein